MFVTVLTSLVGRTGDNLEPDEGVAIVLGLEGVTGGDATLIELTLFLRAALWGRGLIGRELLSTGKIEKLCSFFSSSDELSLLRVPAFTGDDGFCAGGSFALPFVLGRYFGRAEVVLTTFFERRTLLVL